MLVCYRIRRTFTGRIFRVSAAALIERNRTAADEGRGRPAMVSARLEMPPRWTPVGNIVRWGAPRAADGAEGREQARRSPSSWRRPALRGAPKPRW